MKNNQIIPVINLLDYTYPSLPLEEVFHSPFQALIATVISQRTRDDQTLPVARNLLSIAKTPQEFLSLSIPQLRRILHPAGKSKSNAKRIRLLCKVLVEHYHGYVPSEASGLLALPGVGRKTANIILTHCFGKDAIAVDIHVHRITNRLGWVFTRSPFETEMALQKLISKRYWKVVNRIFVRHGQTICTPLSPWCSLCIIAQYCKKAGVTRSR